MYDHSLFLRTLSEFSARLLSPYDVDTALTDLMERLRDVLGLDGSGVAVAHDGHLDVTSAIPDRLTALEDVQVRLQSGPCVAAYRTGTVVAISDLGTERERWPEYCAVAEQLGLVAVAGIPMRLSGNSVGAVNLYGSAPREWSREDLDAAVVMSDMATNYLVNASKLRQQEQLTEQLQHALDTKGIIDQAKGIVASEHHTDVAQAFERIRAHARSHHVTIRSVAEGIVQLGLRI